MANLLAEHGAVLLRGFNLLRPADFERIMLSIPGMYGMNQVLLSEPGRALVDGTNFVFHTNTEFKTGGSMLFGMFHTENYGVPDVPHYIAFHCQQPGTAGGETGLLNMAKLYADLPASLQERLEAQTCLVSLYSLSETATRYGISTDDLREFCKRNDVPLTNLQGCPYISIYKPSVIQHPLTHDKSLLVGLGLIPSLGQRVVAAFLRDYAGLRWFPHRLFWSTPKLAALVSRRAYGRVTERRSINITGDLPPVAGRSLASLFTESDVDLLAVTMRQRYSSFPWQRGDVLIVDNLKMAHNGMAGYGKRDLKVMMCTPLRLPTSNIGPGLHAVRLPSHPLESLGAQLMRVAREQSSTPLPASSD
jgi:alpha-ketoglutarate-dependent taurine dioxygenase